MSAPQFQRSLCAPDSWRKYRSYYTFLHRNIDASQTYFSINYRGHYSCSVFYSFKTRWRESPLFTYRRVKTIFNPSSTARIIHLLFMLATFETLREYLYMMLRLCYLPSSEAVSLSNGARLCECNKCHLLWCRGIVKCDGKLAGGGTIVFTWGMPLFPQWYCNWYLR